MIIAINTMNSNIEAITCKKSKLYYQSSAWYRRSFLNFTLDKGTELKMKGHSKIGDSLAEENGANIWSSKA